MNLSIIIPTLNEEAHIGRLLIHLQNHLKPGDQICVVDAQSSDNTVAIAEEMGAKVLHSECRSRAIQMNMGARNTQAEILYFVHADTFPPDSFREDIAKAMQGNFDLGGYRFKFDSNKSLLKINAWFTRFHGLPFRGGDQTLFVNREIFKLLGGFDEYYSVMEEYDFLRRAKEANYRFRIVPKDVLVSDRKYCLNNYFRVNYANIVAMHMFKTGQAPHKIKHRYHSILNHPKEI